MNWEAQSLRLNRVVRSRAIAIVSLVLLILGCSRENNARALPDESTDTQMVGKEAPGTLKISTEQPELFRTDKKSTLEKRADPTQAGPEDVVERIKHATVFIKVEVGLTGSGTGSGFVVKTDGDTVFVVTNRHVAMPRSESAQLTVVIRSGTDKEQALPAQVAGAHSDEDLAILRVSGVKDPPSPVDIPLKTNLKQSQQLRVCGFPFGTRLAPGEANPAVTVNTVEVSAFRKRPPRVQLSGSVNHGNSGGPVVDAEGRLAGVIVSGWPGTGISQAIPTERVAALVGNGKHANKPPAGKTSAPAPAPRLPDVPVRLSYSPPPEKEGLAYRIEYKSFAMSRTEGGKEHLVRSKETIDLRLLQVGKRNGQDLLEAKVKSYRAEAATTTGGTGVFIPISVQGDPILDMPLDGQSLSVVENEHVLLSRNGQLISDTKSASASLRAAAEFARKNSPQIYGSRLEFTQSREGRCTLGATEGDFFTTSAMKLEERPILGVLLPKDVVKPGTAWSEPASLQRLGLQQITSGKVSGKIFYRLSPEGVADRPDCVKIRIAGKLIRAPETVRTEALLFGEKFQYEIEQMEIILLGDAVFDVKSGQLVSLTLRQEQNGKQAQLLVTGSKIIAAVQGQVLMSVQLQGNTPQRLGDDRTPR